MSGKPLPIAIAASMEGGCTAQEPYALRVIGTSMEPEFEDGTIIIVDPAYPAKSGAYIVCDYDGETTLRQLVIHENRRYLKPLNDSYPTVEINQPIAVRGVVVQQSRRGRRRKVVHYV